MSSAARIVELDAEIARLEALRGTPGQPAALSGQIGLLKKRRRWHWRRLNPVPRNSGPCSLHEGGSASAGGTRRRRNRFNERPLIELPDAAPQQT